MTGEDSVQPTRRRTTEQGPGKGVVRFYADDAPGFQIGPTAVLASSLMFIGIVVMLHILGKFRS